VFPPAADHPWQAAVNAAVTGYHAALDAYVEKGGEDHVALLDRLVARGAVFAHRPLCPFLRPHFVLRAQYDLVASAVSLFRSAVAKARDRIVRDPGLLDLLALTDGERRLFEHDPDYKSFGVHTRLDAVLSGDDLQMVELNAEGAFGGTYADTLTELFEGFQPMRELSGARRVTALYQGTALTSAILDTWRELGNTSVPYVAVVDWRDVATRPELELVCQQLERDGVPARFVDPRELVLVDGKLTAGVQAIDLVYRRALTSEILARKDDVQALLEAYEKRLVCVVNSFRAKLLDKKILFALLHDPRIQEGFTPEEALAVRRHVPWTRRVAEGLDTGPDGEPIDLLPWASDHRARLVLKPNDEVGARGVVIGGNVDQSAWDRALEAGLHAPFVLQRRVTAPSAMFPEVGAASELFYARRYVELDLHLCRGEVRGLSTRLSATTLCNVHAGAGTVPTFILEDA
jgi:hypothetical protein